MRRAGLRAEAIGKVYERAAAAEGEATACAEWVERAPTTTPAQRAIFGQAQGERAISLVYQGHVLAEVWPVCRVTEGFGIHVWSLRGFPLDVGAESDEAGALRRVMESRKAYVEELREAARLGRAGLYLDSKDPVVEAAQAAAADETGDEGPLVQRSGLVVARAPRGRTRWARRRARLVALLGALVLVLGACAGQVTPAVPGGPAGGAGGQGGAAAGPVGLGAAARGLDVCAALQAAGACDDGDPCTVDRCRTLAEARHTGERPGCAEHVSTCAEGAGGAW